jgi:hypothetical protein
MSELHTPETDRIVRNAAIADHPPTRLVATLTVKCKKLERERDEARFLLKAAQSTLDAIHLEVGGWIKIMKENTD